MLSRVADSLYWMSRYLERAEHTARLIDVDLQLRLDQSPEAGAGRWLRLLEASQVPPPEDGKIDAASLTQVLTLDRTNPSSILSCVAAARENLRQVREQCSTEMWEQLNRLYLQVNSTTASEAWLLHSYVFFRAVQEGAHLFPGRHRLHHVAWRRLAIHPARPFCGAHRRAGATDRYALRTSAASARPGGRERRISGVGGPAEIVRGI